MVFDLLANSDPYGSEDQNYEDNKLFSAPQITKIFDEEAETIIPEYFLVYEKD